MEEQGMKKRLFCALALILVLSLLSLPLSGCGTNTADDGKISIVCTLFPQYDWLRNIVGDVEGIELTLLIANGSDPHSYQPTAADILKISNCDMIVFTGADSDTWVQEALERANNKDIVQVPLSALEGMTLHDVSSHSHTHGEHEHHLEDTHGAFDEHIWLSLSNAVTASRQLSSRLCALDPSNAKTYTENAEEYIKSLLKLSSDYASAAASASAEDKFVLFADRFPFVYLLSEYGIEYQAAFDGCSADVDADFGTVLTLIKEAEHHGAAYVCVTESSDKALATTVISSAKHTQMEILTFNSMQSLGSDDIDGGASYLGIMEENLKLLKTAINARSK